jgi:small subunit ribosomal protein S18
MTETGEFPQEETLDNSEESYDETKQAAPDVGDDKVDRDDTSNEDVSLRAPAYQTRERQSRGPSQRGRPPGGGGGRTRFRPRRSVCSFCVDKVKEIDYKDIDTLRRFLDDYGKIKAARKTGTCSKHQRRLAVAIKRARHLALLPFSYSRFHRGD